MRCEGIGSGHRAHRAQGSGEERVVCEACGVRLKASGERHTKHKTMHKEEHSLYCFHSQSFFLIPGTKKEENNV